MQDLANITAFIMHKTRQTYRILLLGGTHKVMKAVKLKVISSVQHF
jgi:hypothetical protein